MSAPAQATRLTRRGIPVDPSLRVLALGTFVNRAGAGATMTTFALYFTRQVGLAAAQVGLALSIAAVVGMLAQVPLGHLGDVRGPREVMSLLTASFGAVGLLFLVVREFWTLTAVLAVVTALQNGGGAVRNGYIGRIAAGGSGVAFKAYLRAVTNLAISLGAALGGIALWIDRPWAYLAVFAIDGVTGIVAGLVSLRLPHLPQAPARGAGEPRLAVLRDAPFVVVTLLSGVVAMHFVVIEVGVPLWISGHTSAPTAMVAALLVLNTVAVTVFQVRMTRGIDGVTESARAMLHGAIWIALGFAVIATSGWMGPVGAAAVLVVGAGVHVVGEMRSSGGQWASRWVWPRRSDRASTRASQAWASLSRTLWRPRSSRCCASSGAGRDGWCWPHSCWVPRQRCGPRRAGRCAPGSGTAP